MEKYIDLSKLPRTGKGIDWMNINNVIVDFKYGDISDKLEIIKKDNETGKILISYNDNTYLLGTSDITNCHFRIFINPDFGKYKYKKDDIVELKHSSVKILDCFYKQNNSNYRQKYYKCVCLTCGNIFEIREADLCRNKGCGVCANHSIVKGINDMWTTDPRIAELLANPEDGYNHSIKYQGYLDWICPDCKMIFKQRPIYIKNNGFSCTRCGDGISYPNKFMTNILDQLSIDFETEVSFDWCKYLISNKETYGFYDFVIPSINLIIEMDSGLGHGNIVYDKSQDAVALSLIRDKCKDVLANDNGYKVMRINVDYRGNDNRFEVCKNGILSSDFNKYYDLSKIDWNKANKYALSNILKYACELYDSGMPISKITDKVHRSRGSIIKYLKTGHEFGFCSYVPNTNQSRKYILERDIESKSKPLICEENGYSFYNAKYATEISEKIIGLHLNHANLCNALRNNSKYNGFHWKRISKYEFNERKRNFPELTYGDFYNYDENNNPLNNNLYEMCG